MKCKDCTMREAQDAKLSQMSSCKPQSKFQSIQLINESQFSKHQIIEGQALICSGEET